MATIKLTDGGKEFPVNYEFLKAVAENFPNGEQYGELGKAMVDLGIPSITASLLATDIIKDGYDEIWEKGNLEIRRELICNRKFRRHLTDKQTQELIDMDDEYCREILARWADELFSEKRKKRCRRISSNMANRLVNFLVSHHDSRVREAFAENDSIPMKSIVPMKECIKLGITPNEAQITAMTLEDLELFKNAHREVLEAVGERIDKIRSPTVQKLAADFLADFHDPSVRLSLAKNEHAPKNKGRGDIQQKQQYYRLQIC